LRVRFVGLVAFAAFFAFAFVARAVFAARFVGFDFALLATDEVDAGLEPGFAFELADAAVFVFELADAAAFTFELADAAGFVFELADAAGRFATLLRSSPLP
jgi:hypothetical protein